MILRVGLNQWKDECIMHLVLHIKDQSLICLRNEKKSLKKIMSCERQQPDRQNTMSRERATYYGCTDNLMPTTTVHATRRFYKPPQHYLTMIQHCLYCLRLFFVRVAEHHVGSGVTSNERQSCPESNQRPASPCHTRKAWRENQSQHASHESSGIRNT